MPDVQVQNYKKSIRESGFTSEEIDIIWDFYVTHGICKSASQRRKVSDYGLKSLPYTDMKIEAGLTKDTCKVLCSTTIPATLSHLDLAVEEGSGNNKHNKAISIDFARIACITPFTRTDEEEIKPKDNCGEAESILTHIRNSLAHGNTYFFDNGMMMLEDKDNRTITARMIFHKDVLLRWIALIDSDNIFYNIEALREQNDGNV